MRVRDLRRGKCPRPARQAVWGNWQYPTMPRAGSIVDGLETTLPHLIDVGAGRKECIAPAKDDAADVVVACSLAASGRKLSDQLVVQCVSLGGPVQCQKQDMRARRRGENEIGLRVQCITSVNRGSGPFRRNCFRERCPARRRSSTGCSFAPAWADGRLSAAPPSRTASRADRATGRFSERAFPRWH